MDFDENMNPENGTSQNKGVGNLQNKEMENLQNREMENLQDRVNAASLDDTEAKAAAEIAEMASKEEKKKKRRKELFAWVRDIAIAIVIALIVAQFIQPTIVKQHSMQNTLQPNDYLIISKFAYKFGEIEYGDIVVFETDMKTDEGDDKYLIKRVIAVGGDTVALKDGVVYRNGEALDEPYTKDGYTNGGMDETVVPEGTVYALGDNRLVSMDSRDSSIGFVSEDRIIGKAVVRLFPFNKIGSIYKNLPDSSTES